jgi:perosamine synthetase
MNKRIPWWQPHIEKEDYVFVKSALDANYVNEGPLVARFEERIRKIAGAKYAIATNNCTIAIFLALKAAGVRRGDEVLVPDITFIATANAVDLLGATPVLVDVDPMTLTISPLAIERSITKRTRAIVPVHVTGRGADMKRILSIAKKHGLYVIEDAAEAHGATYKGRPVGSIGHIGCFSFYSNKIITTGEGGAVTTDDKALIDRIKNIKNLAFGDTEKFMHKEVGFKYQMTNLQAAVGAGQMRHVKEILKRKRSIGAFYMKHLQGIDGIQLPVEKPYAKNVYWMFNLILTGRLSGKRSAFMQELAKRGVETREDFVPYNEQKIFIEKKFTKLSDCPVASRISKDGFYIPSGTLISQKELAYVVKQIKEVAAIL